MPCTEKTTWSWIAVLGDVWKERRNKEVPCNTGRYNDEWERRSEAAEKGWETRREKQRLKLLADKQAKAKLKRDAKKKEKARIAGLPPEVIPIADWLNPNKKMKVKNEKVLARR